MKNLTDFAMKRNWKQAVIFYIAYLILELLIAALFGGLTGLIDPYNVEEKAEIVGHIVGFIYVLVLYFTVYIKKKLNSFAFILLGVVTGVVELFLGNIISLIIVAILTTLDKKTETIEDATEESDTLLYSKDESKWLE